MPCVSVLLDGYCSAGSLRQARFYHADWACQRNVQKHNKLGVTQPVALQYPIAETIGYDIYIIIA